MHLVGHRIVIGDEQQAVRAVAVIVIARHLEKIPAPHALQHVAAGLHVFFLAQAVIIAEAGGNLKGAALLRRFDAPLHAVIVGGAVCFAVVFGHVQFQLGIGLHGVGGLEGIKHAHHKVFAHAAIPILLGRRVIIIGIVIVFVRQGEHILKQLLPGRQHVHRLAALHLIAILIQAAIARYRHHGGQRILIGIKGMIDAAALAFGGEHLAVVFQRDPHAIYIRARGLHAQRAARDNQGVLGADAVRRGADAYADLRIEFGLERIGDLARKLEHVSRIVIGLYLLDDDDIVLTDAYDVVLALVREHPGDHIERDGVRPRGEFDQHHHTEHVGIEMQLFRFDVYIGRQYVVEDDVFDERVCMKIIDKLEKMDVKVCTALQLSSEQLTEGISTLGNEKYWANEDEVTGCAGHFLKDAKIDGIITITAFGCGPDSLMIERITRKAKQFGKPLLNLTIDEQTGEAGFVTRIEAFVDMLFRKKRAMIAGSVNLEEPEENYSINTDFIETK